MSKIAAIVLAAGTSTRMGGTNKLLTCLGDQPVLRHSVCAVLNSRARPVVVVTGHQAGAVSEVIENLQVSLVHNEKFADGMATSLAAGIAAVASDADGALICLADMPLIQADVINALIVAFAPQEGRSIVVPVHAGRRGHPVLLGRAHFDALQQLTGDRGARALIDENADQVAKVEVGDTSTFADADTPEALKRLQSGFGS